jgi:DNA-directed RNA polymerase subunit L
MDNVQVTRFESSSGGPAKQALREGELAEAVQQVYGRRPEEVFLLAPLHFEFDVEGVPTAYASALQRALCDELRGRRLELPKGGLARTETTDPHVGEDFLAHRLRCVRLPPMLGNIEELVLGLSVRNDSEHVRTVYTGDLHFERGEPTGTPLFNPGVALCELQPGRSLDAAGIYVAEGTGREDATFEPVVRTRTRPLDLEELPEEELRQPGPEGALSGFRTSSLVANPRRHRVMGVVPASTGDPAAARLLVADACAALKRRLQSIITQLEKEGNALAVTPVDSIQTGVPSKGVMILKGELTVPGETHTVGNLLARTLTEEGWPELQYVGYTCNEHERRMRLTVHAPQSAGGEEAVAKAIREAAEQARRVFSRIQTGIREAPVAPRP